MIMHNSRSALPCALRVHLDLIAAYLSPKDIVRLLPVNQTLLEYGSEILKRRSVMIVVGARSSASTSAFCNSGNKLVECFDALSAKTWKFPALPASSIAPAAALLQDRRVIVIGEGIGLMEMDLQADQQQCWTPLKTPSVQSFGRVSSSTTAVSSDGESLAIVGGYEWNLGPHRLSTCWIYNVQSSSWTLLPNMSQGRSSAAAAFLTDSDGRDKLVVAGGYNEAALDSCIVLDNGAWTELASLPWACTFTSSIVFKGRLVAATQDCASNKVSLLSFELSSGKWTQLPPLQSQGIDGATLCVINNSLVVLAEKRSSNCSIMFELDQQSQQWTRMPAAPSALVMSSAVVSVPYKNVQLPEFAVLPPRRECR